MSIHTNLTGSSRNTNDWLTEQREARDDIKIEDIWKEFAPSVPPLPDKSTVFDHQPDLNVYFHTKSRPEIQNGFYPINTNAYNRHRPHPSAN